MPLEELRALIIDDFENFANQDVEEILCRKLSVLTNTNCYRIYDSIIYSNIENAHDLILKRVGNSTTFGYSDVYYKKNMPLLYDVTAFHLHFEEIDSNKTKIKIYVIDPKVAVGVEIFSIPGHRGYRWKSVEPTSIEEYKILLRIGKLTCEKNMPRLTRPDSNYHVPRWP